MLKLDKQHIKQFLSFFENISLQVYFVINTVLHTATALEQKYSFSFTSGTES